MIGLKALTPRGRSFLASGVAALLCALVLGEQDLLRVSVLIIAMPLLASMVVARTRYRLACARRLTPARVQVGEQTTVTLRLENVTRLPTGLLLVEDTLQYALGTRPRFVLDRMESRGVREIDYKVSSDLRGRFPIGPLSVRIADPFGLVELTRSFTITDTLVVTPEVVPLPLGASFRGVQRRRRQPYAVGRGGGRRRRGAARVSPGRRPAPRPLALDGAARRADGQARGAGVAEPGRAAARHPQARPPGEGPRSSFEVAVSAAASIGVHLSAEGLALRLVTDQGAGHVVDTGQSWSLLDTLSVIRQSTARSLEHGIGALRQGGGEGLIIAVLGGSIRRRPGRSPSSATRA